MPVEQAAVEAGGRRENAGVRPPAGCCYVIAETMLGSQRVRVIAPGCVMPHFPNDAQRFSRAVVRMTAWIIGLKLARRLYLIDALDAVPPAVPGISLGLAWVCSKESVL